MRRHSATHSDRHVLAMLFSAMLVVSLFLPALPALANAEESRFVSLINQSRAANGLGALSEFWDLTDDARVHTADMIAAGQIYHSSNGQLSSYTTGWDRLGENVGMGPDPDLLHQAFMSSPGHRANILGDYDRVGVGAARDGAGTLFVTVVFMKSTAAPTPTTTTTAPPATTTTAPPATTTTAPPATSTTASDTRRSGSLVARMTQPAEGVQPATRVANVRADRTVADFRPVFALLDDVRRDHPIDVRTPSGVVVTIE